MPKTSKDKPNVVSIYGIFDKKKKKILKVSLDEGEIQNEFELSEYNDDRYAVVNLVVALMLQ
jgi:hypothetical protein